MKLPKLKGRNPQQDLHDLATVTLECLTAGFEHEGVYSLNEKRPYGSCDIETDIAVEILDMELDDMTEEQYQRTMDYCAGLYNVLGEYLLATWAKAPSP